MQDIEPFYNWRNFYIASEDDKSPFHERVYSETHYTERIYNHYIHPQWDNMGSTTLFVKILFVDYEERFAILEFIGEWNDILFNDVMTLKRNVIEPLIHEGIERFILIGENVLNFHSSDDCYYEEWFDEITDGDGWIALLNFREHVVDELVTADLDQYFILGGELQEMGWRTYSPAQLYRRIDDCVMHRIGQIG